MILTLENPDCAAVLTAPAAKSAVHRALIAAAFSDRETFFHLSDPGDDLLATKRCLAALGAEYHDRDGGFAQKPIDPAHCPARAVLDCGASGTTLRFLLPIAAALGVETILKRDEQLSRRPIGPLVTVMADHGVTVEESGEYLHLSGRMTAGDYRIDASISSQFVSGLLFALTLCAGHSRLMPVGETVSAGYIAMTCRTLADFGAPVARAEGCYLIRGGSPLRSPGEIRPEGDYSTAAFALAMGAVGKHPVTVLNLPADTAQGDAAILTLLSAFGAGVSRAGDTVTVSPAPLTGITADLTDTPDLLPLLAVLATAAEGESRFTHVGRLRFKESDRLESTAALVRALGGRATVEGDEMRLCGGELHGGRISSFEDHRIVMSAAVASLFAPGPIRVDGVEAVRKSYPAFFREVMKFNN